MKMAKIGLPKGSGKGLKVREKSVKSQGILKWILSGNPAGVEAWQIKNKTPYGPKLCTCGVIVISPSTLFQ